MGQQPRRIGPDLGDVSSGPEIVGQRSRAKHRQSEQNRGQANVPHNNCTDGAKVL